MLTLTYEYIHLRCIPCKRRYTHNFKISQNDTLYIIDSINSGMVTRLIKKNPIPHPARNNTSSKTHAMMFSYIYTTLTRNTRSIHVYIGQIDSLWE